MLRHVPYFTLLAGVWSIPLEPRTINGPVIASNFPDPAFIQEGNTYYAFATTNGNGIPYATSPDFNTWTVSNTPAMAETGSWSTGEDLWAPDVVQISGQYIMYYCALPQGGGPHCIGAATASNAAGPYTPQDDYIVCNQTGGGAIDAFGFTDADGSNWLLYKVDGNSLGHGGSCNNGVAPYISTPIMAQRLTSDGLCSDGSNAIQLLDRDDGDGPLIEAPALLRAPNGNSATYFLFFSSGCYADSSYDTSYAVSHTGILGPYKKATAGMGAPILRTGYPQSSFYSPGGLSTGIHGEASVVFHADQGTTADVRQMYTGSLKIDAAAGTVSLA
ncbi:MAG: hypothetical protein GOMPHAMPRED_002671 [Gomphillus americanus]|uniref:Endo-1,5-alpha-L-arabinanase A n=1 Tax=Gomphillus americanus TaxID=1940652 RepID=A0A8H3IJ43_9LECA|nr:MAG: hypothetical protein GOMPHAMPRED_002671 [Gomphillus americanus]